MPLDALLHGSKNRQRIAPALPVQPTELQRAQAPVQLAGTARVKRSVDRAPVVDTKNRFLDRQDNLANHLHRATLTYGQHIYRTFERARTVVQETPAIVSRRPSSNPPKIAHEHEQTSLEPLVPTARRLRHVQRQISTQLLVVAVFHNPTGHTL
jgi:hypothetical protein